MYYNFGALEEYDTSRKVKKDSSVYRSKVEYSVE